MVMVLLILTLLNKVSNGNILSKASGCSTSINNHFLLWYTEADSLLNKLQCLRTSLASDITPDIMCITEAKPKTNRFSLPKSKLSLQGYNLVSNVNSSGRVLLSTHKNP